MSNIDLFILSFTLLSISLYSTYKNYSNKNLKSYILGNKSANWRTIGLSVMATQASAITFLSTPGQGYVEGMSFIQNYLGLPIALIIVSLIFVPIYYKSNVYTAYEYLETRFDYKVRLLTSLFFLMQRGLQAGITIYAPSIILTTILGWDLTITVILVGSLIILYTVVGGSRAVSLTHKYQMTIIFIGLIVLFTFLLNFILKDISFYNSLQLMGLFDKNNAINLSFDLSEKYTIWSGLFGGFFLSLSYFGTDQSQVSRYINGKNIKESQMGLIFNAFMKIPLQFFILFIGLLLFVFYSLNQPPLNFNKSLLSYQKSIDNSLIENYEKENTLIFEKKKELLNSYFNNSKDEKLNKQIIELNNDLDMNRKNFESEVVANGYIMKKPESDFIFLTFILDYLPIGLIGFLIAVIFSAAMSSTSAEISALSAITTIDIYKRFFKSDVFTKNDVIISKFFNFIWGVIAILFSLFFVQKENLIESINIVASLLYGNVLGIFLVAFFNKKIKSNNVFIGAILSQTIVLIIYFNQGDSIGYLWFNFIGTLLTCSISYFLYILNENINNSTK
ncbi:MAG TPA: sodium:solute symporter [Cytophagales bacterium]|jgi:Na+/proline symporter|nr:sodium:solute symporter [Cytophagales bacterium]